MHAATERIYAAAREAGALAGAHPQAELAELINVAPQMVNNWEKRGPSKEALLAYQAKLHINATWVVSGDGPMFIDQTPKARERRHHYSPVVTDLRASEASRIQATIAQLGELLARHTAHRQQTIASVLARFASEPTDANLAKELAMLLQQGTDRGLAGKQATA
jgi:transcriptional regulator with XRE-family HTH domain